MQPFEHSCKQTDYINLPKEVKDCRARMACLSAPKLRGFPSPETHGGPITHRLGSQPRAQVRVSAAPPAGPNSCIRAGTRFYFGLGVGQPRDGKKSPSESAPRRSRKRLKTYKVCIIVKVGVACMARCVFSGSGRNGFIRHYRRMATVLAVLSLGLGATTACRTTTEDVHRWADTVNGPRKLVAVLAHDKYPIPLRTEAALTLVRMKPRHGQHVGLEGNEEQAGLLKTLHALAATQRHAILTGLVKTLEQEITQAVKPSQPDPTYPYKDAAFALLTYEGGRIVTAPLLRQRLRNALIEWTATNFAERVDDPRHLYGTEQLLDFLKADGVRPLPDLIVPDGEKLHRLATLIGKHGDHQTKVNASMRLVTVAQWVDSDAFLAKKTPIVKSANEKAKLKPNAEQFAEQLKQYQEEELLKVFVSMKRVGQTPAINYLLSYAENSSQTPKRRAAALAALEKQMSSKHPEHADRVLALASDEDAPAIVRDTAFKRVAELPRERIAPKLYALFQSRNWRVRRVAADLLLRVTNEAQLDEFMQKLGLVRGLALTEPLSYGSRLAELDDPERVVAKYIQKRQPVQARLVALGYYYEHGTQADLEEVNPYLGDTSWLPRCTDEGCDWVCTIKVGDQRERREIRKLGDYVRYCIVPAMQARAPRAPKTAAKTAAP